MTKVALTPLYLEIVGEKDVKTDRIERLCNSRDMSVHEGIPDAVVYVKTSEGYYGTGC